MEMDALVLAAVQFAETSPEPPAEALFEDVYFEMESGVGE